MNIFKLDSIGLLSILMIEKDSLLRIGAYKLSLTTILTPLESTTEIAWPTSLIVTIFSSLCYSFALIWSKSKLGALASAWVDFITFSMAAKRRSSLISQTYWRVFALRKLIPPSRGLFSTSNIEAIKSSAWSCCRSLTDVILVDPKSEDRVYSIAA
jgi:hypothetical protein